MKTIDLEKFARVVSTCASICLDLDRKTEEELESEVHDDVRSGMRDIFADGLVQFEAMELEAVTDQLTRLDALLKDWRRVTYGQIKPLLSELMNRLYDDAARSLVLLVPYSHAKHYVDQAPFGESVAAAFPGATFDLGEASRCLALDRATACVLHLMRAVEHVLDAAMASLGVTYDRKGWGPVMAAMKTALKAKNELRPFYEELIERIASLKDAIRNPSVHGVTRYEMDDADEIFRATRAFMKTAARQLRA